MKFGINKVKTSLGEVQTTLHWHVQIPTGPTAVGPMSEDLEIRCTGFTAPKKTATSTQVKLQGHTVNYVGKVETSGTITLTFVEGTDAKVTAYFRKWIDARWNSSGGDTSGKQAKTADVKCDVILKLMGPDDEVTQTYKLIGAMCDDYGEFSASQDSEAFMPSITLSYDDHHITAGDFTTM